MTHYFFLYEIFFSYLIFIGFRSPRNIFPIVILGAFFSPLKLDVLEAFFLKSVYLFVSVFFSLSVSAGLSSISAVSGCSLCVVGRTAFCPTG